MHLKICENNRNFFFNNLGYVYGFALPDSKTFYKINTQNSITMVLKLTDEGKRTDKDE